MKLTIEFNSIEELKEKLKDLVGDLSTVSNVTTEVQPEVTTTGIVEHDLTKVLPAKRGRKPKAVATEEVTTTPEVTQPEQVVASEQSIAEEDPKAVHFRNNFSQTIFVLLQQNKIDQEYIKSKVTEYGIKNILELKDNDELMRNFYVALVSEGRI